MLSPQSIAVVALVSFLSGAFGGWYVTDNLCDGKILNMELDDSNAVIDAKDKQTDELKNQVMANLVAEQKSSEAFNEVTKIVDNLQRNLDDTTIRLHICTKNNSNRVQAANTAKKQSDEKTQSGQSESIAKFLRDRFESCDKIIIEHNELVDGLCGYWPADPRWKKVCDQNLKNNF